MRDINIKYRIKTSRRAKNIRIAVYYDGTVIVTTPLVFNEAGVEKFIQKKKEWILERLADFQKKNKGRIAVKGGRREYLKYKEAARKLVQERIGYFNEGYGFKIKRVSIKNQKRCWGSCSDKGNLNFNYRIIFLSSRLADYVIAHELCHLREFNHSKRFWELLEKTIPDYKERKKEIGKRMIVG